MCTTTVFNKISLAAKIKHLSVIRYTPSGLPVLEMRLHHESEQIELNRTYRTKLEIEAKIIGPEALTWQNQLGTLVYIEGFLSQKTPNQSKLCVHIQHITQFK